MQDGSLSLEGAVGEFVMQDDPMYVQGTVFAGHFCAAYPVQVYARVVMQGSAPFFSSAALSPCFCEF